MKIISDIVYEPHTLGYYLTNIDFDIVKRYGDITSGLLDIPLLTDLEATNILNLVYDNCHILLPLKINGYESIKDGQLLDANYVNFIKQTINHNLINLVLDYRSVQGIINRNEAGKTHNTVLFNPIDNDNINANMVSGDNTVYNQLEIISATYDLLSKRSISLKKIWHEFYTIVTKIFE